jgi:hypothetical protein
MPALPNASYPTSVWDADSQFQDRDKNNFQSNPKAEDYQRIAAEIIATQTRLDEVAASVDVSEQLVTANTTLDVQSELVVAFASTHELVLTLPDATESQGTLKRICKADDTAYRIKVVAGGTDTINGEAFKYILYQWSTMSIQPRGTGWYIV